MGYVWMLLKYTQSHILSTEGGLSVLGLALALLASFSVSFEEQSEAIETVQVREP